MSETNQAAAYYYADGQRIALQASTHFVAVRATGEEAASMLALSTTAASDPRNPVETMHLEDQGIVLFKVPNSTKLAAVSAQVQATQDTGPTVYELAEAKELEGSSALIDHGELIVKFESGAKAVDKLLEKYHLHTLQEDYPEPGARLLRTEGERDSAVAVANAMHELEAVEYAVPNFVRVTPRLASQVQETEEQDEQVIAPAYTPNDPLLSLQWGISKIRCPEAWDISRGSSGISIAVIDEGGNAHEDYVLAPGWDARFNDSDPTPNPSDGHGVACAGIVAATANNGKGVAGVAPNCRVRHIRIAYGVGQSWSTTDAIIAAGVRRAVDLGADVLSNSWGGGGASTVVTNAFRYGQTNGRGGRGTPIAAATGNSDMLGVIYPANLSPSIRGFMAVGASNQWDQRKSTTSLDGENWWGSNYGPQVDVVAPGVKIPTTDIMGSAGYSSGNYVNTFNGTSSATPHVAGLMALILSVDPSLRSWEVEDIIKLTARDLGSAGRDQHFGFGRIDARHALEAAAKIWYSIQVTPVFLGSGADAYIRATIRMYNPGINAVRLNGLSFKSHGTNGAVIDQFSFTGNTGPLMLARSGHDVKFTNVLLKANGNRSNWSYSWSASWVYTFWRPGAPLFPLAAEQPAVAGPLDESQGTSDNSQTVTGEDSGKGRTADLGADSNGMLDGAVEGDQISVNRADKSITIVLR